MLSSVSINTVTQIRPSEIEYLKRCGLLTVGAVACIPPSDLAPRLGISLQDAAAIVDACDRLCHPVGEIQIQSLSDICNKFRRVARPRKTLCGPIDSILDGGFRHGSVSEIFGLPGQGKSQLAMQIAAVATMPAVFGGVHRLAPILVIDTEGSWTVERVTQFCTEFGNVMKKSQEQMKKQQQQQQKVDDVEETDEDEAEIRDFHPVAAASRIRFVRAADLPSVAAAIYLFRENCNRAAYAVAMERRHRQLQRERDREGSIAIDGSNDDDGSKNSNSHNENGVNKTDQHNIPEQHGDDSDSSDDDDDDDNFTGGLIIIDSVAALFKESRINDDAAGESTTSFSGGGGGSGGSGSKNLTRNQSISALSRLLSSVADETQSAIIATNQMMRRWMPSDSNNSSSASVPRYIPALGDAWASVPLCRVELKRIHNAPFTSQLRRCVVVRHWDWTSHQPHCSDSSDDEDRSDAHNNNDDNFPAVAAVTPLGRASGSELLLPRRETLFRIGTMLTMPSVDDGDEDGTQQQQQQQQHESQPRVSTDGSVYTFVQVPHQSSSNQQQQQQQQFHVKQEPARRERPVPEDDERGPTQHQQKLPSAASFQQQPVAPQLSGSAQQQYHHAPLPRTPSATPTTTAPNTTQSKKPTLFKHVTQQQLQQPQQPQPPAQQQQQPQSASAWSNQTSPQMHVACNAANSYPAVPPFNPPHAPAQQQQQQQSRDKPLTPLNENGAASASNANAAAATGKTGNNSATINSGGAGGMGSGSFTKPHNASTDEIDIIPAPTSNNAASVAAAKPKQSDDGDDIIFATARSRTQRPKKLQK